MESGGCVAATAQVAENVKLNRATVVTVGSGTSMPGVTGWYGLVKICEPKAGETVVVSAASGAVGSVVGQLAKARGCRAVGIAGGADKCRYVVEELGFDACIDYKLHGDPKSLVTALKDACPNGIDGYFENVGGMILDAVMLRCNAFARVAMQRFRVMDNVARRAPKAGRLRVAKLPTAKDPSRGVPEGTAVRAEGHGM